MQRLFRSLCRNSLLLLLSLMSGIVVASAQYSDLELLRRSTSAVAEDSEEHYPYGLQEGHRTISPFYHLFSATFYVWQNHVQRDVAACGGYAVSNPEYFKNLYARYGLLPSFFYGIDRAVRNTKIGRVGYERYLRDDDGLIIDSVERYSR